MVLPIRLYGDPVLRKLTTEVEHVTDEIRELIGNMLDTMHNAGGIGLAAPQVGRAERICVVDISPLLNDLPDEERDFIPDQPMILINPEIMKSSHDEEGSEEGCLSIPDILEWVRRPDQIHMIYFNADMEPRILDASGFLCRVIQHECDHLNGWLITDHITAIRRNLIRKKLRGISRGRVETPYPVRAAK